MLVLEEANATLKAAADKYKKTLNRKGGSRDCVRASDGRHRSQKGIKRTHVARAKNPLRLQCKGSMTM